MYTTTTNFCVDKEKNKWYFFGINESKKKKTIFMAIFLFMMFTRISIYQRHVDVSFQCDEMLNNDLHGDVCVFSFTCIDT